MQTVSTTFNDKANSTMRKLTYRALMSFPRQYLPSVTFFTIGVSTIGGADIIKGDGSASNMANES